MQVGDIIGYREMCHREDTQLQRGMNFRLHPTHSVLLMSLRQNAPYADRIESDGRVLVYEGHDVPKTATTPSPKTVDQPLKIPSGRPTQNGLFFESVERFKRGEAPAELIRVYEKLKDGIWVFNGVFRLIDAWLEKSDGRNVCKFRLELTDERVSDENRASDLLSELRHERLIPPAVKLEVWKRDKGQCVTCGATDNLHFDHIVPFSKGGSSLVASNIQLLCARHNLMKRDRIDG